RGAESQWAGHTQVDESLRLLQRLSPCARGNPQRSQERFEGPARLAPREDRPLRRIKRQGAGPGRIGDPYSARSVGPGNDRVKAILASYSRRLLAGGGGPGQEPVV